MPGDRERLKELAEAGDLLAEATAGLTGEFDKSEWARRWSIADRALRQWRIQRNRLVGEPNAQ